MTNRRARRPSGRREGAGAPSSASSGPASGWTAPAAAAAAAAASRDARGRASRARRSDFGFPVFNGLFHICKHAPRSRRRFVSFREKRKPRRRRSREDGNARQGRRRARASSCEARRLEARASVRRFGRRDALGARARRGHSTRSASQSSRRSPEVSREGAFVPSRRSRRGSWSRRGCRTCARRARAWAGARRRGSWWRRGTCWGGDVGGCRGRAGARVNWRHHREPCRCFHVPSQFSTAGPRKPKLLFLSSRVVASHSRRRSAGGRAQRPTRAGDGRA